MTRLLVTLLMVAIGLPMAANGSSLQPGDQPREVTIHLELIDLASIDSVQQSFDANFYFDLEWRDESLLHAGPGMRVLGLDEIWHPNIQVLNQRDVQSTLPTNASVSPDGRVIYRQRIWGSFSHPLNLRKFPFDSQIIELRLIPAGFSPEQLD